MTKYTITVEESWLFFALAQFMKQLTDYEVPTAGNNNCQQITIDFEEL